ncbi:TonB-dependent receptor plug domain-containing protein [Mucilaginibacter kameinonensis]|uniref:TonB-dependent receptor plug domain-containing protein n=1 Tax=Mucilaginibacter kameinonensis TaxID=452286 RepID=UPI000EF79EE2|nr:TonB-dependent receptor plug domain-containing protein [Mucilaginibacter kameinonensis]
MKKRLPVFFYKQRLPIKGCSLLLVFTQVALGSKALAQSDTTKKLNEVKVSSSAIPQIQSSAPAQSISTADFKRTASFNVADAIRNFAGVNISDYGGIGGLKTVSVRSLGADNTAVLYNGVQLNDAQNGQIDLSKFNLNNVEEIVLYNAQPTDILQTARAYASANVLAIKTIHPVLDERKPYNIIAGIKGGSFGLVNPYLQWQQRLSKYWSLVINSSVQEANGRYKYREAGDGSDTLATRKNGDVHVQQADGGLYWAKSDSDKFNLQFNFYNSKRGLPGPVVYYAAPTNQRLQNRDFFIQSGYLHKAVSGLQLLINAKYAHSYVRYLDTGVYNNSGLIDEHYRQNDFYLSGALAYNLTSDWKISYSSDADISNLQSDIYKYAFPTRTSLFNVIATDLNIGKWRLQANLLNTYIHDEVKSGPAAASRSAFTPAVIATYKPFTSQNLLLRAYYKSTFRNTTFAEQYYYAIVPRSLKPEYTDQYNVGAAYTKSLVGIFDYINISADAYYNHVKDKISYIPTRSPETPSVVNLGRVDIKGLDVIIKSGFKPFYNWKGLLSVAYTYQQALDVTNPTDLYYLEQIPYTPKHTLALNAGFTHKQFGIYYNEIFSSSRYQNSNNVPEYYLPKYSVSDASFVYSFLAGLKPVTASFEVNNLFNKNYAVISSYPMPGRSYRLTFQITI